jgi:hypothetical protein
MSKHGPEIGTPFFEKCLLEAAATPGMLVEYDRLNGTNLARRGTPLDLAIDQATGRMEAEIEGFVEFVRTYIYWPVMHKAEQEGKILTEFGPLTAAQFEVAARNLCAYWAAYEGEMIISGDTERADAAAESVPWEPLPKEA